MKWHAFKIVFNPKFGVTMQCKGCGGCVWIVVELLSHVSVVDGTSLEGTVVHRAECTPVINDNYMKLKK